MHERCNSSLLAMELCLSCTDPSIWIKPCLLVSANAKPSWLGKMEIQFCIQRGTSGGWVTVAVWRYWIINCHMFVIYPVNACIVCFEILLNEHINILVVSPLLMYLIYHSIALSLWCQAQVVLEIVYSCNYPYMLWYIPQVSTQLIQTCMLCYGSHYHTGWCLGYSLAISHIVCHVLTPSNCSVYWCQFCHGLSGNHKGRVIQWGNFLFITMTS